MNNRIGVLAGCMMFALAGPAAAEIKIDAFGGVEIGFEGLLQAEYNRFDNDRIDLNGGIGDSESELRRAELILKGTAADWNWVVGYDAKADKFLDTNLRYKFSSHNSLTLGQYKQPNSLEELSSTKNNDFISKSLTTNLFAVGRRLGAAWTTSGEMWTVTGSAFGRELTDGLAHGDGYGVRGTFAPVNDGKGGFLHLGLSYVDYEAEDATAEGRARLRARPNADLATVRLIDTGLFNDADRIDVVGAEFAWAQGPYKVQAELMRGTVDRKVNPDFQAESGYVQGVWNITGEGHGYKDGVVRTNSPTEPKAGMWQLGLRYDYADLNDGAVFGGKEHNLTLGVNYYWRNNFRFSVNYVDVNSERGAIPVQDDPSILEFRAQMHW